MGRGACAELRAESFDDVLEEAGARAQLLQRRVPRAGGGDDGEVDPARATRRRPHCTKEETRLD